MLRFTPKSAFGSGKSIAFLVESCYSGCSLYVILLLDIFKEAKSEMTTEFEERMKALHKEFDNLSPEERKAVKQKIKKINLLTSRKLERMKHDLLRMETKRAQLSLDGQSKELSDLEDRIISKKREFLKLLCKAKENCSKR